LLLVEGIGKFVEKETFEIGAFCLSELLEVFEDELAVVVVVESAVAQVCGLGLRVSGETGGDAEIRFPALDETASFEGLDCRVGEFRVALLDLVEGEDVGEAEIRVDEQDAAVVFVDESTGQAEADVFGVRDVEIGQGEKTSCLAAEHDFADTEAHDVDHAEVDHGLGEEAVPVSGGRFVGQEVVRRAAVEEGTGILENQFGGVLGDENALAAGVVLVGDAVVEGFENDALVVFRDLQRDQIPGAQEGELDVADALV